MGTWGWKDVLGAVLVVALVTTVAVLAVATGGAVLAASGAIAAKSVATVAIATGTAATIAGTFNVIEQTNEKSEEEDLNFGEVALSTVAGATRGFSSSIVNSNLGRLLIDGTISGIEVGIKASNNGATSKQQWDAMQEGFANTFISYGIGFGIGQFLPGTERFAVKVTTSETFNGIMGLGSRR